MTTNQYTNMLEVSLMKMLDYFDTTDGDYTLDLDDGSSVVIPQDLANDIDKAYGVLYDVQGDEPEFDKEYPEPAEQDMD